MVTKMILITILILAILFATWVKDREAMNPPFKRRLVIVTVFPILVMTAPDNVTYLDKAVINSIISSGTVDSGQVKTATINTGYGRSAVITRIGNTVTITSQSQYSSEPANGSWERGVSTMQVGFRPATETLIYNHDLTNPSKFSWNLLHTNGVIDLFSNGNIKTTDYILTSGQFWITKDKLPE